MFDSWKFSKGSYLTIIFTALTGTFILGFAYHLKHFSEILTGVIGGLTIILGMITAEWLRSSRQQIEDARARYLVLVHNFDRFLYSYDEFSHDIYATEHDARWDQFIECLAAITLLGRSTRWPQPNARRIRAVAQDLLSRFEAMNADVSENGYVWSIEERHELLSIMHKFAPLIWARKDDQNTDLNRKIDAYRKTAANEGLPSLWERKSAK